MEAQYRNIKSLPGQSLRVNYLLEEKFPACWHFHPQFELTYLISSKGVRYIGDSVNSFKKDDLVLVGTNLPHSWKTTGDRSEKVRCIVIQWDEEILSHWFSLPEIQGIRNLLMLSSRGVKFSKSVTLELKDRILDLLDQEPFDRLMNLIGILERLSRDTHLNLLASKGFTNTFTIKESSRITEVYSYVSANYANNIAINDISELVSMRKETFCRFFKKTHQKSFITFLNEFRINIACKLLIETDLSVTEIGYKVGYNNLGLFYRFFSRYMKLSPSKYRLKYISIESSKE